MSSETIYIEELEQKVIRLIDAGASVSKERDDLQRKLDVAVEALAVAFDAMEEITRCKGICDDCRDTINTALAQIKATEGGE